MASLLCLGENAARPRPGLQTHRHEEHGEEVDHGLHVEPPLGGNTDRGEEGQAAERRQEEFGHKRPHGLGRTGGCRPPGSPGQANPEGVGSGPSAGAPVAAGAQMPWRDSTHMSR